MFEKLKTLRNTFSEIREQEEGFTLVEMLVSMGLFTIFAVAVSNPVLAGTQVTAKMAEVDTTVSQAETAVDLRNVYLQAARCVANYDAQEATAGTYSSGSYFEEITRPDIQTCLNETTIPSTLAYEVKRTGANNLCVVGYDTTRNTDKYTPTHPYIYYGPSAIVYKDSPTPCGWSPDENQSFKWEEMK